MTGYGRGEIERDGVRVTAELRSFNNRFLELTPKIPRFLAPLEGEIKTVIHRQVSRGRVLVNISWEDAGGLAETISLDEELADHYYGLLQAVKGRYNLPGDIDLSTFTALPDILRRDIDEWEPAQALPLVEEALAIALEEMVRMKSKEGGALARDLAERIDRTLTYLETIQRRIPRRIEEVRQKLAARLAEVAEQTECSEALLAQELVLFTDRSDCTEECVRYQVHCDNFKSYLAEGGAVGRKLNFLLQEMARETNTMGVKASDADVSTHVVLIKEELERIREQVQNIE
ncbi:MAG: YicC/YloC family endoribonuclease [Candidatus Eisenbacteria bacterium]